MIRTTAQTVHQLDTLMKYLILESRSKPSLMHLAKALESTVVDLEGKLSTVSNGFASGNVTSSGSVPPPPVTNSNTNQQRKSGVSHDCKFSLIIRGIPECPPNTKSLEQFQLDQHKLLKELSHLNGSINPSCIKDTF